MTEILNNKFNSSKIESVNAICDDFIWLNLNQQVLT